MLRWLLFYENYASYDSPSITPHSVLYKRIKPLNFSFISIHFHHLDLSALQTVSFCKLLDDLDFKRWLRALKCVFSHKGEKHNVKGQISFKLKDFVSFFFSGDSSDDEGNIKDVIIRTNNCVVPTKGQMRGLKKSTHAHTDTWTRTCFPLNGDSLHNESSISSTE